MRKLVTGFATGLALWALPVAASADEFENYQAYSALNDRMSPLMSQGFSASSEDPVAARDAFLEAALIAEKALAERPELLEEYGLSLHLDAANGYYYAAIEEGSIAEPELGYEDLAPLKLEYLLKALHHQRVVFADGQQDNLVYEFYETTRLLVEHGRKTDDPQLGQWSADHVTAARLRIDESRMLKFDNHYDAMGELALALLDHAEIIGTAALAEEAAAIIAKIPEGERGYDLQERLE